MKNKHFRAMSAADAVGWWNRFSSDVAARFKANISVRGLLSGALAVFLFIFGALRLVLAFVMLWLRGLVLWVLQAVAAVALMTFLAMLVVGYIGSGSGRAAFDMFWPMLALSFGAAALGFLYDLVLMAVAPGDELMLFQ